MAGREIALEITAMTKNILYVLWSATFLVWLAGGKTHHLFRATLLVSAFALFLDFRSSRALQESIYLKLKSAISRKWVYAYIGVAISAVIGAIVFDFEALNGTMWDLAQYIQAIFYQATQGAGHFTFATNGTNPIANYSQVHRTLSLPVLGFLYQLFEHAYVGLFWQGFFLVFPGVVAVLWYRSVMRSERLRPQPLGEILAFSGWLAIPTVLAQVLWPYTFHIAGLTCLALAYLFYYRKNWTLWTVSLALFAFEKEEFGIISASFGLLVLTECLFKARKRKWKENALPVLCAIVIVIVGAYSYSDFAAHSAKVIRFSDRFGHLGATPLEALKTIFFRPMVLFQTLNRPNTHYYVFYFLTAGLVWYSRRWSTFKYFIPVLPLFLANILAVEGPMQLLKDHYALPLAVGVLAMVVFGVFAEALRSGHGQIARAHWILSFGCLFSLCWSHQSPFRSLKESYQLFRSRLAEREAIHFLTKDPGAVVCCEERLCSRLADREYLLEARFCREGTQFLSKALDKPVYYLVYNDGDFERRTKTAKTNAGLPYVAPPLKWKAVTPYLKVSDSMRVTPSTSLN
ncbi:MAG: DUF2079 domain-containing protein [Bdellovibrionota bacterium]